MLRAGDGAVRSRPAAERMPWFFVIVRRLEIETEERHGTSFASSLCMFDFKRGPTLFRLGCACTTRRRWRGLRSISGSRRQLTWAFRNLK